jgi:transcriptional regulator with XRE-family HTH domain
LAIRQPARPGGQRRIAVTDELNAPSTREDRLDRQGLANAVTARMDELRLEQHELAKRASVSISYLRHMQNGTGTSQYSWGTLSRVSRALKWPEDRLHKIFHRLPEEDSITPSGAEIFTQAVMAELQPYLEKIDAMDERISLAMDLLHHVNDRIDAVLETRAERPDNDK